MHVPTRFTYPADQLNNSAAAASASPAAAASSAAAEASSGVLNEIDGLGQRAKKCAVELGERSEALGGRIESLRTTAGAVRGWWYHVVLPCCWTLGGFFLFDRWQPFWTYC